MMEAEASPANQLPQILHGAFPALSAALLIAMGYIDPGKWIACIDGGARFGGELFVFLFLFNLMAVLCQYLSAHIGAVTGQNLAQICNDEYGKVNCISLGIQAEISIIMSDLSMVLGIANTLHMMFRVDLFSAVLLTAVASILFPLFSALLESSKANTLLSRIAGLTFVCYVLGMLISQPEISTSAITLPSKLVGENVYALMTLLGANIMPHNFFLHSSIVQRFQGSAGAARGSKAYDNFIGIVTVFSGIFIVNYMLMNSASNMFYSSGIILPTFEDAMSIMEQSSWPSMGHLAFFLLLSSSHISGLSWEFGGESGRTLLYDFFGIDLPGWLHCATIRVFAVVPALYCLWYSGAEGMYQMLLSTQVIVALLLPPSVIVLYRVASSGALMGTHKVSPVMELVMTVSFIAMVGLQLAFCGELVFGNGAWLGYLRWNMGSMGLFSPYFILIVIASASLCLTCHLFVTPLRSADPRKLENDVVDSGLGKGMETRLDPPGPTYDIDLPDNLMETHQAPPSEEISTATDSSMEPPTKVVGSSDALSVATNEATVPVEKTLIVECEPVVRKDSEKRDSEGLRSLSGKLDEGGSLSRLSGLGRAARRQLAAVLDEFWGQLYDFHGQLTQEAKAKKLGLLLGSDLSYKSLQEAEAVAKDLRPHFQSESMVMTSGLCNTQSQRIPGTIGSLQGVQKAKLDVYMQGSNALDNNERRYSSLRLPPRSEGLNPPATLHGYQIPSYLSNRTMLDPYGDQMDGQRKYVSMKIPPSSPLSMRDPLGYGYSSMQPSAFQNHSVSRNSMFQSDRSSMMQQSNRSNYELFSPAPAEGATNQNNSKKYNSLPDISGISVPLRSGYPAVSRAAPERSIYSSLASRMGPPGFDDLSPGKARRDLYPSRPYAGLDAGSIWYKQPYEQYGVANKMSLGSAGGQKSASNEDSASSIVDWEVKLLQSLRSCVVKLLKLEGSEWLFRQGDGVDEDLIDGLGARERFVYEAECRDMKMMTSSGNVSSVPHCGEGCVWKADLIVSFGVWCIHRVLELSLMESRPELWGKYTYVLNRLQGVIEPAFFKQRNPVVACFCMEVPSVYQRPQVSNGSRLPPVARSPRGKFTTSATLIEVIKDVEIAISSRKGRSGTAAGDVAFPKGKENLASVLKRYKRRLSNKPVGVAADATRPGIRNPLGPYAS